jgi:hypothetical protein
MLSFRRAVFCSAGFLATLALSTGVASASPIVNYQVTTVGCFNCTIAGPFTDNPSYGGYFFNGVTTLGSTDASGHATVSLGTMTRNNENYTHSGIGNDFVLQVTFVNPLGISNGADKFVATIVGDQGNPGDLTFADTFKTYTFANEFGTGSFEFRVNDLLGLNKNHSADLTGMLQNATFVPSGNDGTKDVAAVPEPASLVLLGSGLAGAARMLRRRAS